MGDRRSYSLTIGLDGEREFLARTEKICSTTKPVSRRDISPLDCQDLCPHTDAGRTANTMSRSLLGGYMNMRRDGAGNRGLELEKGSSIWYAACTILREGSQDHDTRDDQTLPGLSTATNQTTAHRYRALRLRQTYLAGLILPLSCRPLFPLHMLQTACLGQSAATERFSFNKANSESRSAMRRARAA